MNDKVEIEIEKFFVVVDDPYCYWTLLLLLLLQDFVVVVVDDVSLLNDSIEMNIVCSNHQFDDD